MDDKKLGLFSLLRWSPGSIVMVLIMTIINLFLVFEDLRFRLLSLYILSGFSISIEIFFLILRRAEIITPSEKIKKDYVNAEGIALTDFDSKKAGVVKISNETWSAYSDMPIKKKEKIVVVKKDGIYLIVKKKI